MDPPKCEGRRDMSGGRKGNSDGGDDHGSSVGGGGGGNNNNNNGTEGGNKSSSQMLGLLDEFTKIYSDRLQRVEQASMKTDNACYLQVSYRWKGKRGEEDEGKEERRTRGEKKVKGIPHSGIQTDG